MTTTVQPNRLTTVATRDHRPVLRRLAAETEYSLAAWPLTVAAAVMVTVLTSVGAGLAVLVIGVPVPAATLLASRRFAEAERRQLRRLMQRPAPTPVYHAPEKGGRIRRARATLGDPQSYLDIVHSVSGFLLRTFTFCVTVVWWGGVVGGLGWVVWGWPMRI